MVLSHACSPPMRTSLVPRPLLRGRGLGTWLPMNMQTHSDVTDNYRYVCNNSVKHNSLWYAFVTGWDLLCKLGPFDTAPIDGTDNVQLPMLVRKQKSRRIQQSRHTSISGTFAAGSSSTMMYHSRWVDQVLLCTLTSLFLDTSPRYGATIWLLVSVIVNIFIMISSRTIVIVQPKASVGFRDMCHTPACGVMRIVPDRSAVTLLPTIRQHVCSGTIVYSDK